MISQHQALDSRRRLPKSHGLLFDGALRRVASGTYKKRTVLTYGRSIVQLASINNLSGSKARFENETGTHVLTCFNHHVTDFIQAANAFGFRLLQLEEQFDEEDRSQIPRILNLLFEKL